MYHLIIEIILKSLNIKITIQTPCIPTNLYVNYVTNFIVDLWHFAILINTEDLTNFKIFLSLENNDERHGLRPIAEMRYLRWRRAYVREFNV